MISPELLTFQHLFILVGTIFLFKKVLLKRKIVNSGREGSLEEEDCKPPLGIQGSREPTLKKDRTRCPTPLDNYAQFRWPTSRHPGFEGIHFEKRSDTLSNSAGKLRWPTPLTRSAVQLR